jgi:hypothetical protein
MRRALDLLTRIFGDTGTLQQNAYKTKSLQTFGLQGFCDFNVLFRSPYIYPKEYFDESPVRLFLSLFTFKVVNGFTIRYTGQDLFEMPALE